MTRILRSQSTLFATLGVVLAALALLYTQMAPDRWVDLIFRGLTLGMLYFLVASGLSLIFGLMDVLNFAHGAIFMIGAYGAWSFFTNPKLFWTVAPLVMATAAGWLLMERSVRPLAARLPRAGRHLAPWIGSALAVGVAWYGLRDFDLVKLATVNPLPNVQMPTLPGLETDAAAETPLILRTGLLLGSGLLIGAALGMRPDRPTQRAGAPQRQWILGAVLAVVALLFTVVETQAPAAILAMNSNLRFVLALAVGTGLGALFGVLMETTLIRPLYERPLYQVLVTLGLTFVLTQGVRALFGPTGYQMAKPAFFDTALDGRSCTSESLWAFLGENCVRVQIWGATIPSYRLFIIALGLTLLIVVGLILQRSRLGIIIRAGVQDSEMVEALGINVRRVFTLVFALGAGIAALGGAAAAPLLRVDPDIGLTYQLQAFVVVVLGGMGSFGGAAIGALIVGLAEAFSTYLVTSFRISTSIATASTVIIMAVVLLVRPAGLFGKKE